MNEKAEKTEAAQDDDILLVIRGLRIEGQADEEWHEIVHGVDLTLRRGEVIGLIGESGAGKSTIGLAAMCYSRDGCRISGGSIVFDGVELMKASDGQKRRLRGSRIAYVAQSAAASFNPAHRLIDQYCEAPVQHACCVSEAPSPHLRSTSHDSFSAEASRAEKYPWTTGVRPFSNRPRAGAGAVTPARHY